ncbi:unnamed protein product [Rotaria sp. Silwood2]|nr:unnamed protein product [Rotaria sp. Silwood2]CAF3131988.1 unnamed protein product [Rotaria sp. Silwood2]CAF4017528.1 unnamed protein product [Rotaria sp. Silwood2]CAF4077911.1 unnamed protein product [Rotaria sp. Silwood2]
MAMEIVSHLVKLMNESSDNKNVNVYLLFKAIAKDYYIDSVRISHWQVVCHFKDKNRYKCYELKTDTGDIEGRIIYRISNFNFYGHIYYYYIGQCNTTEADLERKCEKININNQHYMLGFRDCQTWARLLIESLELSVKGAGPFLMKYFPVSNVGWNLYPECTMPGRVVDFVVEQEPVLKAWLSQVKHCRGYKSLK